MLTMRQPPGRHAQAVAEAVDVDDAAVGQDRVGGAEVGVRGGGQAAHLRYLVGGHAPVPGDLLAARAKGLRKAELLDGHAAAHAHGIRCGDGGKEVGSRLLAGRKDLCGVADFFQAFLEFVESFHGQPS